MPSGIECGACVGGIGLLAAKNERNRRLAEQQAAIARVARKVLGRELQECQSPTLSTGKLRLGADTSVSESLSAIETYQEKHWIPGMEITIPACAVGVFKFGGQTYLKPADIQTTVCEDLKSWLLVLASGTLTTNSGAVVMQADGEIAQEPMRNEVTERVEFIRQLLMRPDIINDPAFFACLAEVCDHLTTFDQQNAGDKRTCADCLARVVQRGNDIVDCVVPMVVFAILEIGKPGLVPILTLATLAESAANAKLELKSPDVFSTLFDSEAGSIVTEFLRTAHCRQMWCSKDASDSRSLANRTINPNRFLELWLEYQHKWMDAMNAGGSLETSGFEAHFRTKETQHVRQLWLDLLKNLDNFIKFISVVDHYQNLARIAGDAGMSSLRASLHHILQEIEFSLGQVQQLAVALADHAKSMATEIVIQDGNPSGHRALWVERLQFMHVHHLSKVHVAMLHAIKSLRFLSSEARLPELKGACMAELQKLADISASTEFRSRCANQELPSLNLHPQALGPAPRGPETSSLCIIEEVGDDSSPRMDPLDEIELDDIQVAAVKRLHPEWILKDGISLERAVEECNDGNFTAECSLFSARFSIIFCGRSLSYFLLCKHGCRHAAMSALNAACEKAATPPALSTPNTVIENGNPPQGDSHRNSKERSPDPLENEQKFYETLLSAVFPYFNSELLNQQQVSELFSETILSAPLREAMIGTEAPTGIDAAGLQRIGRIVAHVQSDPDSWHPEREELSREPWAPRHFLALRDLPPEKLPVIPGVVWNRGRIQLQPTLAHRLSQCR